MSRPRTTAPTPRQRQIIRHIAMGMCKKEIALTLGIAGKTVDAHLNGGVCGYNPVQARLGFHDAARLTHWAIMNGLVKLGEPIATKPESHV